jgi:hypothetical protein
VAWEATVKGLVTSRRRWAQETVALGLTATLVLFPLAGAATGAASATVPGTTPPAPVAGLRVSARIDLGKYPQDVLDEMAFAAAPDDAVYFAIGPVVRRVTGSAPPVTVLRASGPVLALAAADADLYVQVGLKITDYSLPGLSPRKSWTLPRSVRAPTMAGLLLSPGVVWSWTDWATDESGFEYATIVAISTTTSAERIVDTNAYPADLAAGAAGLYYETVVGTANHLAHATTAGTRALSSPTADSDAPLALGPGYLAVFAEHGSGVPYVDKFSTTGLGELRSSRIAVRTSAVVGTATGVLAVEWPCPGFTCPTARVVWVNAANGAETAGVAVPDAQGLLDGASPAVIAEVKGSTYLVRLG